MSEKKKALLEKKKKLLEELMYNDRLIDEARKSTNFVYKLDPGSDSDSDEELLPQIDSGPSIAEYKHLQSTMKTCLEATMELGSLMLLRHEVSVVENPCDREILTHEPGVWHKVIADCKVDLIEFSTIFYVHKPYDSFASRTYYGLQVNLTKKFHETELAASILNTVKKPSDALEVIRNYAEAYRSRRSTLARLTDKYEDLLCLEQLTDGGYLVRSANLLELQWTLENRSSPIAAFRHRTKLDLEYMEEDRVNRIRVVHKKLSDPQISTEERTALLADIIDICVENRQENPDGGPPSSDAESGRAAAGRRALDGATAAGDMAPPRSLPKKARKTKSTGIQNSHRLRKIDEITARTLMNNNQEANSEEEVKENTETGKDINYNVEENKKLKSAPKTSVNKVDSAKTNTEIAGKAESLRRTQIPTATAKEKDIFTLVKNIEKTSALKDIKKRHAEELDNDLSKKSKPVDNAEPKDKISSVNDRVKENKSAKKRQVEESDKCTVKKIKTTNGNENVQSKKTEVKTREAVKSKAATNGIQKKFKYVNMNKRNIDPTATNEIDSKQKDRTAHTKDKDDNIASAKNSAGCLDEGNTKKIVKKVINKDSKVVNQVKKLVSSLDVINKDTLDTAVGKNKENVNSVASSKDTKSTNPSKGKQPSQKKVPLKTINKLGLGSPKNIAGTVTVGSKEKENDIGLAKQNLIKSKLPLSKAVTKIATEPTRSSPRRAMSTSTKKITSPRASGAAAAKLKPQAKPGTNIPRLVPKQTKT